MRTKHLPILLLSLAYGITGCGSSTGSQATGGSVGGTSVTSSGGATGSGGASSVATSSSSIPSGGSSSVVPSGGVATGGVITGGTSATGGTSSATTFSSATGGASVGGSSAMGGTSSVVPTGGSATGGSKTGGTTRGGMTATGGQSIAGGAGAGGSAAGGSTGGPDCSAARPSNGSSHCGSYQTGTAGSLSYELWSNSYSSSACITTFSTPAFSAKWSSNGDFLARVGLDWAGGKTLDQLGTVTADLSFKKSGSAGGYSYIGIYGWSNNPCVEWYIIDDSFGTMPFNAYGMSGSGSATLDGETYKFFSGTTRGTGGSKCNGGESSWGQFWSVRQKARQCGTISITNHFNEWKKNNMALGKIIEAKILVEVGGGQGSVDFAVANVTAK